MRKDYVEICGVSDQELHENLDIELHEFAETQGLSYDKLCTKLKEYYDGYHFTHNSIGIYNPFSLLNAFKYKEFGSYWFETGTPTYLVKLLKKHHYDLERMAHEETDAQVLNSIDSESTNPIPVIYQSGYLTIKGYDERFGIYRLGFPNREVEEGFIRFLLPFYANVNKVESPFEVQKFVREVETGDYDSFFHRLQSFFADTTYEVIRELESPQRVAAMIKNDLKHTGNDGEFTENGYEQEWASKKEVPQRKGYSYQSGQTGEYSYEASQGRNDKLVKIALIVLIALIGCPVVIPVGVGIFGVIAGLLIAAVCFFAALVIASLAVVLAGFVVAVTGIGVGIAIHSVPAVLLMAGIGLILIALGVLATLFTGKLCIVMYPAMFRFIVKLCRKPFHRKAVSE